MAAMGFDKPKDESVQAPDTKDASGPGPPFHMSPVGESQTPSFVASSPEAYAPSAYPSTRRTSAAESFGTEFPPLAQLQSSQSGVSESVFSEMSAAPFFEIDRKLEKFVLDTEPEQPKKEPAANIPISIPDELKHAPYTFDCAFGWTGEEEEDMEDTPKTKAAFVEKLAEAKEGTAFILTALISYQSEINSRRHHKFKSGFLAQQNTAIVVTNDQLDQINEQLDTVISEVNAINEEDGDIKDELITAYQHAAPWIKRTKRVLYDAHVFYKLNYTLGAKNKTAKKTRPVDMPGAARNGI